jgi:hypothetical protein
MINKVSSFFTRMLGPGSDFARAPGLMHDVAEDCPAFGIGAGLGGAAGAAVGYGVGLHNLHQDQVSVVTERTEYLRPQLIGARYIPEDCTTHFTYDDKGNLTGSYQTCDSPYFRPLIENHRTGLIESRQKFVHTNAIGPLGGAAIGLGIGAVSGAVVGLLAQKIADPHAAPSTEMKANRAPLIGVGVGALVGGGAGYLAGHLAQAKSQTLTQVVNTPVTVDAGIGWVPYASDRRELTLDQNRQLFYTDTRAFEGRSQVVRAVPTGEYRAHTEVTQSHNLSPWAGAALGVGIGAVAGGLGGVAVGVLHKLLDS